MKTITNIASLTQISGTSRVVTYSNAVQTLIKAPKTNGRGAYYIIIYDCPCCCCNCCKCCNCNNCCKYCEK